MEVIRLGKMTKTESSLNKLMNEYMSERQKIINEFSNSLDNFGEVNDVKMNSDDMNVVMQAAKIYMHIYFVKEETINDYLEKLGNSVFSKNARNKVVKYETKKQKVCDTLNKKLIMDICYIVMQFY